MKLVFPIQRFNWYRTLAPVIDEALRRGHAVECWHNVLPVKGGSNRPDEKLFPRFRHGRPAVKEYRNPGELVRLLCDTNAEAIFSIDLPLEEWFEELDWERRRFRHVTIATTDTLRRLLDGRMIRATDLICVRSEREIEACIADHTEDYRPWIARARAAGADGARFIPLVEKRVGREWDGETAGAFRARAVVTGFPLMDGAALVDRDAVRRRWGAADGQPLVGFWSTPTQGRGYHGHWDRLFARRSRASFRWDAVRSYGARGWRIPFCNEHLILRAVQAFSRNNGARLVTKLRHYQRPGESLYSRYTDETAGEECYYPHTALELAAVADLMIGFHTSGMPEAVFAGSPVLNLVTPGFPHDLHMNTLHFFDGMFDAPGVVTRMEVAEAIERLPHRKLADFRPDPEARDAYLANFAGPSGGRFAANVLDAFEAL